MTNVPLAKARQRIRLSKWVYICTTDFGLVRISKRRALQALNPLVVCGRKVTLQTFGETVTIMGCFELGKEKKR